jgi:hypothetical protein
MELQGMEYMFVQKGDGGGGGGDCFDLYAKNAPHKADKRGFEKESVQRKYMVRIDIILIGKVNVNLYLLGSLTV